MLTYCARAPDFKSNKKMNQEKLQLNLSDSDCHCIETNSFEFLIIISVGDFDTFRIRPS